MRVVFLLMLWAPAFAMADLTLPKAGDIFEGIDQVHGAACRVRVLDANDDSIALKYEVKGSEAGESGVLTLGLPSAAPSALAITRTDHFVASFTKLARETGIEQTESYGARINSTPGGELRLSLRSSTAWAKRGGPGWGLMDNFNCLDMQKRN